MLHAYADKMLKGAPVHTRAPQADAPRGRCPNCEAVGPLVVNRREGGRPRPEVLTCRCPTPPAPVMNDQPPRTGGRDA